MEQYFVEKREKHNFQNHGEKNRQVVTEFSTYLSFSGPAEC